jgi:phosphatidylglycerophosphate synthase
VGSRPLIARAIVVGPAPSPPAARVAGLSLWLRTLLALQDAGITEVVVHGVERAELPAEAEHDPRVKLRIVHGGEVPDGAALVVPLGCVWHVAVAKRLVATDAESRGPRGEGAPSAALWITPARELAATIATLARAERPAGELAAPRAPEFVTTVRDDASRRATQDLLFRALIKPTDGFVSRYLNRKLSMSVTRLLLNTSVTPNQMTLFAAVFGFAGALLAWRGATSWGYLVGATLLVQTQSVLDGCDGELARLKYLRSSSGEWLDQVLDDFVNIAYLVGIGHTLAAGDSWFARFAWPITLVTLASHTAYQIGLYVALVTKGRGRGSVTAIRWRGQGPPKAPPTAPWPRRWFVVKKLFEDAGRRDFFTFAYVPCALVGATWLAFGWHAFIATVSGLLTTSQWLFYGGPESAES